MTEGEFRLTPVDVRNQEFPRGLRGYDTAAVEEFRGRVADELERLLREKAILEERTRHFRDQLTAFREREKAMSDALVAAEQLRTDAARQARHEVDGMLNEARIKADRILEEARIAETNLKHDQAGARRQFVAYVASFRALLERNLAELEALEREERDHGEERP